MNVNFDINAMLKSVIEDFQNIARNVKISFKIRRLNEDNHRLNGEYGEPLHSINFYQQKAIPCLLSGRGYF